MTGRSASTPLRNISYLTPFFAPAVGGAARYVEILGRELLRERACDSFRVVTERHPSTASRERSRDGVDVLRVFPHRAGATRKGVASYAAYGVQNLGFLGLARWLGDADVAFVHGSFLNNPSLLPAGVRRLRRRRRAPKLVLDLRDPKFPAGASKHFASFDAVIASSENIRRRLDGFDEVWVIPIMIEPLLVPPEAAAGTAARFGLRPQGYVFNGSGFHRGKGTEELVDVVTEIRRLGHDVDLAIAGKRRHWTPRFDRALREGWLRPLGELPTLDVRQLAVGSWIDVNLSTVDSLPRHSLEALQSGARVFLPAGVPEFDGIAHSVAQPGEAVASMAERIIHAALDPPFGSDVYDVSAHAPGRVIQGYLRMIEALVA